LLVAYLVVMTGCYTRVEGCLDIAASNFDFNADKPCSDCCTYPTITVSLSQKWNDRNFSTNDTLLDLNGKPYHIKDLDYYLSSWSWSGSDGKQYTVDSAEISCENGILQYTPDILQVDSKQFTYKLGTIRQSPAIDSVQFKLGLHSSLECVDETSSDIPPSLSDESPLWDPHSSSRAALRIVLQRDTTIEFFDTLFIHGSFDQQVAYDLDFTTGIPVTLNLSVNYAAWFSNVDITLLGSFEESIRLGVPGSFFKTP